MRYVRKYAGGTETHKACSQMDNHTLTHTEVRQAIQTQTPASFLGSNHEAKVYSLTPVALQTSTQAHSIHSEPTDQPRQQREGQRGGADGGEERFDGGGSKEEIMGYNALRTNRKNVSLRLNMLMCVSVTHLLFRRTF